MNYEKTISIRCRRDAAKIFSFPVEEKIVDSGDFYELERT